MALFDYKMLLSVKLEENEKYDFLMSSVKSSIDEENYKKVECSDEQFDSSNDD
jgi:tRNA threonylcarbamoyladenosine modification (KEOPS) complex Cgi121 subunit